MSSRQSQTWLIELLNVVLVLGILVGGACVRYLDLGVSLYDDELNTRDRALQSAAYTLESRNYPLYYLSAKAALLLGDTEEFLRLPSFVAGLLSILALYGLVRQLHSRTAGLLAAALLAVSPFHIVHSTFARYYALLMLFTILTVWCLYHVLRRGRWYAWVGYTVSAFLGLASHVCFAPAVFGLNAGAAAYLLFDRSRNTWLRRIAAIVLLGLCSTLAAGNLIYRDLNPAKVFNLAENAAHAPGAESAPESPASAATDAGDAPAVTVEEGRPEGAGRKITNTATGEVRYKLTIYDCVAYLKRFFWNYTFWLWPLFIAAGVWGVLDLALRRPAAGLPLATGFLLSPVPLFFLSTGHWYHPRYLSYLFIFALILIAIGLCVVPRFAGRLLAAPRSIRLWRMAVPPEPAGSASNFLYACAVAVLLGALSPALWKAYHTYPMDGYLPRVDVHLPGQTPPVNKAPARDFRGAYEYMARTVRDGDPVLYMMGRGEYAPMYARHYLAKSTEWRDEEVRIEEAFGAPAPARLRKLAETHPMANLWFVGYLRYNAPAFEPIFTEFGAARVDFLQRNVTKGVVLYHRGAPTANHIRGGEFDDLGDLELPEGVHRVSTGAYSGRLAAKVELPAAQAGVGATERFLRMPIKPAHYRLRNAGFEAWSGGRPVGWSVSSLADGVQPSAGEGHESPSGLRLGPADVPVVLQQSIPVGLAPGRRLEARAMVRSATPDNVHLVLRFQAPGMQHEVQATHTGTDEWEPVVVAADVPSNVDPASITVEVARMAGGEGEALVDDVAVQVLNAGAGLDPLTPYVLSLSVRSEDLRLPSGADRQPAGQVRLAWTDASGNAGHTALMNIYNDPAWRKLSAIVQPGRDFPVDLASLHLEAGIMGGTGALFVDQIQLEPGMRPTPYTPDIRLPHDEALSGMDLEAHAVSVAWGE